MDKSSPENLIVVKKDPDGIAYVTINRPKSLNSLTRPMMMDLARAFKSLDADDSVAVIILSGSGRSFCSGVDLTSAENVFKGDVKDVEADPVAQMERCRKPIIGAISGFAITAGFEISLACDVLIASKDAKFIDTHARFGIFPSWGLSQKLSRIIGPNKAREVSLTAGPLTAEKAEKWGLVNHVVEGSELLKKAREVAEAIMKNNQDLVLRYKAVINDGYKLDLHHALLLEKITMAQNVQEQNSLRSILEKEKLNGTNFINWYRNLRIVLKQEKKLYVLEQPIPEEPAPTAPRAERDSFKKHDEDDLDVSCLMLITMESELQKQHETMGAFDMIEQLKLLFQEQARHERFETSKALFQCKMAEGNPVGPHMLKMIGYIEHLEGLGFPLRKELAIDIVLLSLPNSYSQFVMNYNMHDLEKSLPELLNMLITVEQELLKGKSTIMIVRKDKKNKSKGKSFGKSLSTSLKTKGAIEKKSKGTVAKEGECFHCGKPGHWRRNCPLYLEEKKKGSVTSTSGTKKT